MKRWHLFEFGDQTWFSSFLRDFMTDYLGHVVNRFDFYQSILPVIEKGLAHSSSPRIIDLGSGAGGGWKTLAPRVCQLNPEVRIVLTDQYPNLQAWNELIRCDPETFDCESGPVDARQIPERLTGLRTQFLSLHHFKPSDVRRILQNAVDANQPIAIFEAQKRDLKHFIQFSLSPLAVLMMTPAVRPFRWSRLLFTYLVPLVPLTVGWDGAVSVLRTYNEAELQSIIATLENTESYTWEFGDSDSGMATISHLLGCPK